MVTRPAWCLLLGGLAIGCGEAQPTESTGEPPTNPTTIQPPDAGLDTWLCQPGELVLDGGGCLAAGIGPEACAPGFVATADRACEPVLPASPCAPGTMALPGEPSCRAVAPCAPGTWGDIPVDASTEHVDAGYTGGASDGSAGAPWTSIQAAVSAAADGAIVAIAAGSYAEQVVVAKRVRLWGRCPDLVEISAPANGISIGQGGDGSEVKSVAITGADVALHVGPSTGVVIDRVWIHDARLIGIDVEQGNPGATITRSLVESTTSIGVFGYGAALTVEDTVVRDILPTANGGFGHGIRAWDDAVGVPTVLVVRRSLVERTRDQGIVLYGSRGTVEDTVVRDIQPELLDGMGGEGILALVSVLDAEPSTLAVTGSLVERTHFAGIQSIDGTLVVERTVVRDVVPPPGYNGSFGIAVTRESASAAETLITVRSVVVEATRLLGIGVADASGVVEAAIVRDTQPQAMLQPGSLDVGGRGIEVGAFLFPDERHALSVRGCRVERVHEMAVSGVGGDLEVESTLVSDVARRDTDGMLGRGVTFQIAKESLTPAGGSLRDSLVERTHDHGVAVVESVATIESTWIRDIAAAANGTFGRGISVQGHVYADLPASATLRRLLVERTREAGIMVIAADVHVENSVVSDTAANDAGELGDGIVVSTLVGMGPGAAPADVRMAAVEVADTLVAGSVRAGVAAFGADVTARGALLDCNSIDLNGEVFFEVPFTLTDLGGNTCACAPDVRVCKVLSAGLAPPDPAPL